MRAIYKREVFSYFVTPIGYIYIGIFLALGSLIFGLGNLSGLSSDMSDFFSMMSYVWMLLTPVLGTDRGTALLVTAGAWLATVAVDFAAEHSPLRLRERLFRLLTGSKATTSRDLMAAASSPVVPQ